MTKYVVLLASFVLLSSSAAMAMDAPARPPAHANLRFNRQFRARIAESAATGKLPTLPAGADKYRYVLVKGLLGNNYPGYMKGTEKALKAQGLSVEFAPINTAGSVADNQAVIENMIKTSGRPIVFVTHSKGSVDTTMAIGNVNKTNPGLVSSQVRGLVSMDGAVGGSPVVDALETNKIGRGIMKGIAKMVHGSVAAGYDLNTHVRVAAESANPMPTDKIPTVSIVGYHPSPFTLLGPGVEFVKKKFGLMNDGLVPHAAAVIPGSDVAYLKSTHATPAFGKTGPRMALAAIDHMLRMPVPAAMTITTKP